MSDDVIRIACPSCKTTLKVKLEWAGRKANCTKCQSSFLIELPTVAPPSEKPKTRGRPATSRQRDYARNLEIDFADDISFDALSDLISQAVEQRQEQDDERQWQLQKREGEAYDQIRAEIIAELDGDDPRVSVATTQQIVEALEERGIAAVLVTFPLGDADDFAKLDGVQMDITHSDSMTLDDATHVLAGMANPLAKQLIDKSAEMLREFNDSLDRRR